MSMPLVAIFEILSVLAFVIAIISKKDMKKILWQCDRFFRRHSHTTLSRVTRAIIKMLTSNIETQKQYRYIYRLTSNIRQLEEGLQRGFFLLEVRGKLREKARPGSLSEKENLLLRQVEHEFEWLMKRVSKDTDSLIRLRSKSPGGVWIAEFHGVSYNERWEHDKEDCIQNFGCCSRGCGCCNTLRRAPGKKGVDSGRKTHCTIECGCCIRWRGFRRVGQEEKYLIEVIKGGSTAEESSLLD